MVEKFIMNSKKMLARVQKILWQKLMRNLVAQAEGPYSSCMPETNIKDQINTLKPKSREMPKVHLVLTDDMTGNKRQCNSSVEMLKATQQVPQRWMGPPDTKLLHFFF